MAAFVVGAGPPVCSRAFDHHRDMSLCAATTARTMGPCR